MTFIDFNKLTLREANQRRLAKTAPVAWSVVFGGCGHRKVIPDDKLVPIERRGSVDYFYCDLCSAGDRSGTAPEGFCTKSTLHPLETATPLFSSHYNSNNGRQTRPAATQLEEK